jgi:sterol desaturase/sphingolipid hydroxylase (fatty acid hydroxylase superfamily)
MGTIEERLNKFNRKLTRKETLFSLIVICPLIIFVESIFLLFFFLVIVSNGVTSGPRAVFNFGYFSWLGWIGLCLMIVFLGIAFYVLGSSIKEYLGLWWAEKKKK